MQAQRLPAARGWYWIVDGFRLFRRNPPLLGFLVFGYWFLLLLIDMVPVIGPVAASLCVPALSVSVMNGCRAIDRGQRPDLNLLLSGFQRHPRMLGALGGLNFVCWMVVLGIGAAIDGGTLTQALTSGRVLDADTLGDSRVQFAVLTTLLLMVPVLMAFWFAPLLVAWDNCPPGKALFFSFIASWHNGRAFFGYGMGIMLLSGVLPGLLLGIAAAFSETLFSLAAAAFTVPLMLVFVPTLFASFYVSYRDVFEPPLAEVLPLSPVEPPVEPPAAPPSDEGDA